MKTTYTIEIKHDEDLYQADIREYVQNAINSYRGGLHMDDERRSISCVKINKVKG